MLSALHTAARAFAPVVDSAPVLHGPARVMGIVGLALVVASIGVLLGTVIRHARGIASIRRDGPICSCGREPVDRKAISADYSKGAAALMIGAILLAVAGV